MQNGLRKRKKKPQKKEIKQTNFLLRKNVDTDFFFAGFCSSSLLGTARVPGSVLGAAATALGGHGC
jgi:hypothetical protein